MDKREGKRESERWGGGGGRGDRGERGRERERWGGGERRQG